MNEISNFKAKVDFVLLNQRLSAAYDKTSETEYKLLLAPTPGNSGQSFSIEEMVDGVNSFVGSLIDKEQLFNADAVKSVIKRVVDPANYRICMKQLFLYVDKRADSKTVEYAFEFSIVNTNLSESFKLFAVESLSFSVWNTLRPSILKTMDMRSIENILAE